MGGKVCLFGGDFRQILPVILGGSRGQIVDACLMRSTLWRHIARLSLSTNMRVNPDEAEFASWLLEVGEGRGEFPLITVPPEMRTQESTLDCLIADTFPDFRNNYSDKDYIEGRVILTTTNKDVDKINEKVSSMLPSDAETKVYLSADSVGEAEDVDPTNFPVEFLHSLAPNGMPPHRLRLTVGMVIMLLRNMNKKLGLCNGSRLIVKRLQPHVIEAEVLGGTNAGRRVYIPRIETSPANTGLPFVLKRRQFPIRPAYAMTINKSQGQTLRRVGLSLLSPVFTHGQLYVALSRVRRKQDIRILLPESSTQCTNCVYREVFN